MRFFTFEIVRQFRRQSQRSDDMKRRNLNTMLATAASVKNTIIVDRETIRNALMELGIKSHDDVFCIGNDIDIDTLNAVTSVIVGYVRYLSAIDMYSNSIMADYMDDDYFMDSYLESVYAVIGAFQNFHYVQRIVFEAIDFGEIPYGMYSVHSLTTYLIESVLVAEGISSQFAFCLYPQNRFFDENLTGNECWALASA